ncbi:MAG TPA: DUF2235 domain-containing protein [Candidatus Angelobacter sp.]|nr:DUF2235 domain-containing protein [Candidatus Angelobacter sp.]
MKPGLRFGFSRGAYTARALCGMLEMFGLLPLGNERLRPFLVTIGIIQESISSLIFKG